jgi:hypothetical protein
MAKHKHMVLHLSTAPVVDNRAWFTEAEAARRAGGYFEKMAAWMKAYMRRNKLPAVAYVSDRREGFGIGWARDNKGCLRVVEIYWPVQASDA